MSLYQNSIYVGDSKYTNDSAQIAPLTAYKSYNRQSIARSAEKKKRMLFLFGEAGKGEDAN